MSEIIESSIKEQSIDGVDIEPKETETTVVPSAKKKHYKRTKSAGDTAYHGLKTENTQTYDDKNVGISDLDLNTGDVFETRLTLLYRSSVAPVPFKSIHGIFYIWDNEIVNNRIRLTNLESDIGNIKKIIGWVNVDDILTKN